MATNNSAEPYYFISDHLGSVRGVINTNGEVVERNDYYPFGLRWNEANSMLSDKRYRYNGKEEQAFINVSYIDYGARIYDPKFRLSWNASDPLAEKYYPISPYAFCANNPVRFIDLTGEDIWEMDYDGRVRWIEERDTHIMYALSKDGARTGQSSLYKIGQS